MCVLTRILISLICVHIAYMCPYKYSCITNILCSAHMCPYILCSTHMCPYFLRGAHMCPYTHSHISHTSLQVLLYHVILCGAHVCPYTHSYIAHTCPYTYSCTTYHHLMWRSYVSSHVFSFHVHPYGAGPEHWQHLLLQRRRRDHVGGSPPFLLPYPLPPSLSPSLSFSLSLSFPLPLARSLARSLIRPSRMHLSKHIHTHTANIYLICINMYMYVCVCVYTYTYIYIL